jgi:polyhydroxyalkanoate synthase
MALDQGLAINQRLSEITANSVDWLFKRDTLIKSGRTWFELVHDGDLMAVRYYELPDDDEIELVDGRSVTSMPCHWCWFRRSAWPPRPST